MLLQRVEIIEKKLLVDDKITACVKDRFLLTVVSKVLNRKTLCGETFCFPEKHLLSILNFVRQETYCFFFYELLIDARPTSLECIVIFL